MRGERGMDQKSKGLFLTLINNANNFQELKNALLLAVEQADAKEDKIVLKHRELGSLKQISDALWNTMQDEAEKNGYSDLTLALEGFSKGIDEIIELNNIVEREIENVKTYK